MDIWACACILFTITEFSYPFAEITSSSGVGEAGKVTPSAADRKHYEALMRAKYVQKKTLKFDPGFTDVSGLPCQWWWWRRAVAADGGGRWRTAHARHL